MASIKISELDELTQILNTDILPVVDTTANETKKVTLTTILDLFYPVGSYYETSDTSFNPNSAWGGTWVEDTSGRVTVASDSEQTEFDTVGETGGEKTHTLTTNEMPTHAHNVTGLTQYPNGVQASAYNAEANNTYYGTGYWTRSSSSNGGNAAHNNLQPYIVVKRWHRTA